MPERIQLRRTRGWRKPPGAMSVARPTRWGNPCRIWTDDAGRVWAEAPWWSSAVEQDDLPTARAVAASALYRHVTFHEAHPELGGGFYVDLATIRRDLAGHDLACWCPLDGPCHADVLLDLANPPGAVCIVPT